MVGPLVAAVAPLVATVVPLVATVAPLVATVALLVAVGPPSALVSSATVAAGLIGSRPSEADL